mmetsp:Transcript_21437/g.33858  ORF Transcript_21437/g.33858 Transcript_21437/m.33858 type:complete len:88 (-) Transcript_21437:1209-1472(-)
MGGSVSKIWRAVGDEGLCLSSFWGVAACIECCTEPNDEERDTAADIVVMCTGDIGIVVERGADDPGPSGDFSDLDMYVGDRALGDLD